MNMNYLKSFTHEEFMDHVGKLQKGMVADGLDFLLLTAPENIFYASGYRSWYLSSLFRPVFLFLPKHGEPAIALRFLEKTTVQNTSWLKHIYCSGTESRNYGVMDCTDNIDAMKKFISSLDYEVKTIGIEAGVGTYYQWSLSQLKDLMDQFPKAKFVDGSRAIQGARMIKSAWEVNRIETAGYITERAIVDTFATIMPGRTTEKEIAAGISSRMCANGIDRISYLTVNSGKEKYSTFNSYATDRIVQPGELVLVDISGHIDGYASDLTRTMYLGKDLPKEHEEMAAVAMECVHAGFKAMRPGITAKELNQIIEDYISNSKYGRYLVHSSGHSIGLNVVEYPTLDSGTNEPLQEGMVFALENGVYPYEPEKGAESIYMSYRMEDEALVEAGGARWLSGPGQMVYTLDDFV